VSKKYSIRLYNRWNRRRKKKDKEIEFKKQELNGFFREIGDKASVQIVPRRAGKAMLINRKGKGKGE